MEPVDLNKMGLIYVCYHCNHQTDNFEAIHAHWLKIHKRGDEPLTKRFCYRVTKLVRCVYCPSGCVFNGENLTYQNIRKHFIEKHPNCKQAYAMHNPNVTIQIMQCGQCAKVMNSVTALQAHFEIEHETQNRPDQKLPAMPAEPFPMINDAILNALKQQGDQGTFKCAYCSCFFSCRYDYDQHHRERHSTIPQKFELNGKDIIKYGCYVCPQTKTDELEAIEHLRAHYPIWYQCQNCTSRFRVLREIVSHHQSAHGDGKQIKFKMICSRDHFTACGQLVLTFANGLTFLWSDLVNTDCGNTDRLRKIINDLNETQNQIQLKAYNEMIRLKDGIGAIGSIMAGKIGPRRQTHL